MASKKKGHKFITILIVLILVFIFLLWLFNYLGVGLGGKKGNGEDDGETGKSQAELSSEIETEKEVVQVIVLGGTYVYKESPYSLEEFEEIVNNMDKDKVVIEIIDNKAVANSINSIHKMLDKWGFSYIDTESE